MITRLSSVAITLAGLLLMGCGDDEQRAGLGPESGTEFNPVLKEGSAYFYRNWNLDQNSNIDTSSEWKSTWRVTAQGQSIGGFSDVFVITDSSFSVDGTFLEVDTIYIRIDENKDLHFLAFLTDQLEGSPLEELGTLVPMWNRILAFSVGVGNSWTIASIDTTVDVSGFPTPVTFSITGTLDGQETVSVPAGSIEAYKVTIHTEIQLGTIPIEFDTLFWFSDNPSGLIKEFLPSIIALTFVPGNQVELESFTLAP